MALTQTRRERPGLRWPSGSLLTERLDSRHNSINALRLGLAFIVLVSHSVQLSTGGDDVIGRLGSPVDGSTMAVDGFFALSGYLIVGSYLSSRSTGRYLWRRCLRIFPGFWVCLVVSALVIGPLTALLSFGRLEGYAWTGSDSAVGYMWKNTLLLIRQFDIAGGFGDQVVNGSLHTLFYEFVCYLGAAAAGVAGLYRLRRSRTAVIALGFWLLALLAVFAVPALLTDHHARELMLRYGSMFLFGGLAHLFAGRIRVHPVGYVAAAGLLVAAVAASVAMPAERALVAYVLLAPPAVAYLVLVLGASTRVAHIGSKRDLSYGLYVYAWPVQATLLILGAAEWSLMLFVAVSLAISLGLAYLSWTWIEAPALRLKSWTPGGDRSVAPKSAGVPRTDTHAGARLPEPERTH